VVVRRRILPGLSVIDAQALRQAIAEFNREGRTRFLKRYGFSRSSRVYLIYGQRLYDTKALVAAAYRYATRKRLRHSQFSGGEQTQAVFGRVARDDSSFNQIIDDRLGELRNLSTEYDRIPRPWPRANQPQVNVNIDVKAGYVIDLSPADEAERLFAGANDVVLLEPHPPCELVSHLFRALEPASSGSPTLLPARGKMSHWWG
jgi:hypothetical protein